MKLEKKSQIYTQLACLVYGCSCLAKIRLIESYKKFGYWIRLNAEDETLLSVQTNLARI